MASRLHFASFFVSWFPSSKNLLFCSPWTSTEAVHHSSAIAGGFVFVTTRLIEVHARFGDHRLPQANLVAENLGKRLRA
jgi:hypothetical protein